MNQLQVRSDAKESRRFSSSCNRSSGDGPLELECATLGARGRSARGHGELNSAFGIIVMHCG